MNRQSTLLLKNISIGYKTNNGNKIVASDISGSINSGELTILLGANGAGKSTLLRTLSGFCKPLSGSISVFNKNISEYKNSELSKLMSVVLTESTTTENMIVSELVGMGRSPYTGFFGKLSNEDLTIVEQSIKMVGIEHLKNRRICTLSDGERQKAMIAKALAQSTPIILLDEPAAFLDYPSKVEVMQLLRKLSVELNKTIFLSTHDLELSLQIADCVWLMKKNTPICVGVPEDLMFSGTLNSTFKRPGINFSSDSGVFNIITKCTKSTQINGIGTMARLVKKALYRKGICPNNENSYTNVDIINNNIYVSNKSKQKIKCENIAELISYFDDLEN